MAQWYSNWERLPNMLEALSLILNGNKTKYSIYRKQEESMDGGKEHKRYQKAKKECRFKSNLIEDYSKQPGYYIHDCSYRFWGGRDMITNFRNQELQG